MDMDGGETTCRRVSLKSGALQSLGSRPSSCSRGARPAKARMQLSPRCAPSCRANAARHRPRAASHCVSSAPPRPWMQFGAGRRAREPGGPSLPQAAVQRPHRCGSSGRSCAPGASQPARNTRSRNRTSTPLPKPLSSASAQAPARSAGTGPSSSATATGFSPPPATKNFGGLGGGGKVRSGRSFAKSSRQPTGLSAKAP
mmetsp:Transcript_27078/g.56221  ORF Transcript_27078/g.56221 Transcript_27078/m.56221 type:complete len:200 (-) Transcript_27078:161-760(-)